MPQQSNTNNEVHQLGNSVNQMLMTINQQMVQLTELDSQRRQLLAHLSHDLRKPLASLQGYLELIDKQHAKPEGVMTNLIDNAIRHTPAGGNITIEVNERHQHYTLAVRDTGLGISSKELPYILEARYQASNSQGCKKTHAGLGLAITSRLIRLLKSEIKVESELGKGTEFTFSVLKAIG